jgi:hypothetical protein
MPCTGILPHLMSVKFLPLLSLELHTWVGLHRLKNFNDTIKNRTRNWRAWSAVPHSTASPRALDRM